ncbi:transposase [Halomonas sp. V046]|uniref:transposase n=1 Tax=Halomonas sp. V046 TaxID=3459611 RepID=UPI00404493CA
MQRKQEPVIFAVPGHGKDAIKAFSAFLAVHGGDSDNIVELVCDISSAFLSGVVDCLPKAEVTVDAVHIAQTFTKRLDEVRKKGRKKERQEQGHPKSLRWALLKSLENENPTPRQLATLQELVADQSATSDAWVRYGRKTKASCCRDGARSRSTGLSPWASITPLSQVVLSVELNANGAMAPGNSWESSFYPWRVVFLDHV